MAVFTTDSKLIGVPGTNRNVAPAKEPRLVNFGIFQAPSGVDRAKAGWGGGGCQKIGLTEGFRS